MPQVERGTVVRIQLPGQDMTVKLLSPLEYSTCTCHKKELCSHKAEAILWCQYLEKQLTAQELTGELEQEPAFDLQELRDTAGQVKDCLEHLLETGLARSGAEQAQELERLAILCHNAGLPGWEGDIRALAEGYEKYLRRAAGQTMEKLAGQLQRLYSKTLRLGMLVNEALLKNEDADLNKSQTSQPGSGPDDKEDTVSQQAGSITSQIQTLAGEFRAEYLPVGDLELTGITVEHFVSDSGYEGDTVYFLEIDTGTWYTYTNARPTFYEGKREEATRKRLLHPGVCLCLWRVWPACGCCCGEQNVMPEDGCLPVRRPEARSLAKVNLRRRSWRAGIIGSMTAFLRNRFQGRADGAALRTFQAIPAWCLYRHHALNRANSTRLPRSWSYPSGMKQAAKCWWNCPTPSGTRNPSVIWSV